MPWRKERLPTPVFWPREFHGLYSPKVCKESDMTEQLSLWVLITFGREDRHHWLSLPKAKGKGAWALRPASFVGTLPLLPCCSVTQSCPNLCDPMDCSTSGFPALHYLPELAQTHVHWISDATQPSHPLPSPSPSALNLSQHHGLFQGLSPFPPGSFITLMT